METHSARLSFYVDIQCISGEMIYKRLSRGELSLRWKPDNFSMLFKHRVYFRALKVCCFQGFECHKGPDNRIA